MAGEFCSRLGFPDRVRGNKEDDDKQRVNSCKNKKNQSVRTGRERMLKMENSHTFSS